MTALEELLKNRFIVKQNDKDKFYRIKDALPRCRPFIQDKLGYRLIVNPLLIKLEKIPGKAEPYMGIMEFSRQEEYGMLCVVLMFLEEKNAEEQFVLSQLTEYVQANYAPYRLDWTNHTQRRSFIKVMKFCAANSFFKVTEGDDEAFVRDEETEVLYEVVGASRYFMRHFIRDITDFASIEDFEKSERFDQEEDRGVVRRNRIYRKLVMSPCVTREGDNDEDFIYLRNFRGNVEKDMNELNCDLHIHRECAFIVTDKHADFSRAFPENNNLSDITLLIFKMLREAVERGDLTPDNRAELHVARQRLLECTALCKRDFGQYYGKTYRERSDAELLDDCLNYMEGFGLARQEDGGEVVIMPLAARFCGIYTAQTIKQELENE
ncbi:MAG: TIGR02678 family protein [Clostridiales bacterium]|nr:TIGR02678 family protein [Clostridiales bacterium]